MQTVCEPGQKSRGKGKRLVPPPLLISKILIDFILKACPPPSQISAKTYKKALTLKILPAESRMFVGLTVI